MPSDGLDLGPRLRPQGPEVGPSTAPGRTGPDWRRGDEEVGVPGTVGMKRWGSKQVGCKTLS